MPKELKEQASEILAMAEKAGVQGNFFFTTTFQRYLVQINILEQLEQNLNEDGLLVTKEYVKGRGNVYTHPAVPEYNRTTDSANKTVRTLMNIIREYGKMDKADEIDPIVALINGEDVDE